MSEPTCRHLPSLQYLMVEMTTEQLLALMVKADVVLCLIPLNVTKSLVGHCNIYGSVARVSEQIVGGCFGNFCVHSFQI